MKTGWRQTYSREPDRIPQHTDLLHLYLYHISILKKDFRGTECANASGSPSHDGSAGGYGCS